KVLVNSTGIIGVPLDMEKVREGIASATKALSPDGGDDFAAAIMTTDTRKKVAEASIGGARIVGFAKGAGMVAPEVATMLAFVVTDAAVEHGFLVETLKETAAGSFNAISVDGCRSTNDTLLVLANGAAGGETIIAEHPQAGAFKDAMIAVCGSL